MGGLERATRTRVDFHDQLHLRRGGLDMRTPVVNELDASTHEVTGWELRPDLLNRICRKRGCRVVLYPGASDQ